MMTNFKRGRFSFIRLFAVIPLLIVMIFAFGAVKAESEINVVESELADNVAQTAANGKETTIEEPNEVHHPNLSAPTVSDSGKVTEKPAIGGIIEQNTGKSVSDQDATLHIAADGKISLNGKTVALAGLESALRENKPAMVVISADKGVNMGQLADVRQILRNANVLRVKYINGNNNQSSPIVLPPAPQNVPNGIKLLDEITDARIPAQNLFRVLINNNDKILCVYKQADDKKTILVTHSVEIPLHSMHILTGIIKEHFIGDAVTKGSADSEPVTYTLSDGRNVEYPMSEGIVSIDCSAEASYEVYAEVDKAVKQAFDDLRLALAKDWFGFTKTIEDLSEADLNVVKKAIPLKVRMAEPRKDTKKEESSAMGATSNEQQAANRIKSETKSPSAVGDIPYGVYKPHGFDTKWEFTKLSQEQMNDIWMSLPSFTILSADELKISFWRDVDYIKSGIYKYQVSGRKLYLHGSDGETYNFPLTLEITEGVVEMKIGVDVKVCGIRLKEINMSTELKNI